MYANQVLPYASGFFFLFMSVLMHLLKIRIEGKCKV